MTPLETWLLIGACVATPGLLGWLIGRICRRLPPNDGDDLR